VLKLKRISRGTGKREHYLSAEDVRILLNVTAMERHPMTLAVHLMLYTGLRKSEALRLKWHDIEVINGIECVLIRETKNKRPHYIPVTHSIQEILNKSSNHTAFLFPSPRNKLNHTH